MLNYLLYVTIAGGLLPLGSRFWWGLEIFSHFRLQYLVLALPLLVVALWQKQPLAGAALFVVTVANAWPVLPDLPLSAVPKTGNRIVVLNMNVRARNLQHARVLERIRESGADVVTLIELSRALDLRLGELSDKYPHRLSQPGDDSFGLAVLSRHPLRESAPFMLGSTPALEAVVDLPDGPLRFVAVHPRPPVGAALAGERNTALRLLAAKAREITGPLLVCGDFNLTPYSPHFGDFERDSGLVSARRGRGLGISWPTFMPLLGVPIDHCFLRAPLATERVERMARSGSDHYPVRVTLRWQGKP